MSEEVRAPGGEPSGDAQPSPRRPRRRRRGGRGRGPRSVTTTQDQEAAEPSAPAATEPNAGTEEKKRPARRRRPRSSASSARASTPKTEVEGGAPPETGSEAGAGEEKRPTPQRRQPRPRRPRAPAEPPDGSLVAEAAKAREDPEGDAPAVATEPVAGEEGTPSPTTRRRRRRRKKPSEGRQAGEPKPDEAEPAREKAPATRAPRPTRTRRKGTVVRRRREPDIKPERRVGKVMLITEHGERDQIVVIENEELAEHYVTRSGSRSMVGNIYIGKVQNVLPGMEAAFVDVGKGRNAVLYAGEVSYDEEVDEDSRRIEQALKPGQNVLVQVTKDPIGGKGARLTGQVSVPGRYLVYVPDGGASGISRRLPEDERTRLRDVLKKIRPSGAGVIVRTAAEGAPEEGLAEDLERLRKSWDSIKRKSRRGKSPRLIYEEPELTVRVVRDVFSPVEFREIVTDSPAVFERVTDYLREIAPDLLDKVRLYQGSLPVLEEFRVHEQIHKALERKVWLSAGGYLIFDRTEAMTVIDVNTGKAVGKRNLEETVVQTNLEAAKEIARQLRLRDTGGIIVIDFIDMLLQANRSKVIRTLKEEMAQDRTRSQVFDITPLGLLEVTRKRVSAGLVEAFSETCPTCEGRGILVNLEP